MTNRTRGQGEQPWLARFPTSLTTAFVWTSQVAADWPRFIIKDEKKKLFWTGSGWTPERKQALLYADAFDRDQQRLGLEAGVGLGLAGS